MGDHHRDPFLHSLTKNQTEESGMSVKVVG